MRLAESGLLESYAPASTEDVPARFRDPAGRWTATAARPRVLAYDPQNIPRPEVPGRWEDLANPDIAPHVAYANPLFGTTRGHVAAMMALWGPERTRDHLRRLREHGAQILDSNSATVRAVMDGRARFAATDSDDVYAARKSGAVLDYVYPDMGDGGTLLVPSSVALIKGGAAPDAARRVADFLASAEVERRLAQTESRNIPVRESLRTELGMPWPAETKVEFARIAESLDAADQAVREILIRP
jgi:iron(III) transport system substrate-binding protein